MPHALSQLVALFWKKGDSYTMPTHPSRHHFFWPSRLLFVHRMDRQGSSLAEEETEEPALSSHVRTASGFRKTPPESFFGTQLSRYLETAPEEEKEALQDPDTRDEVLREMGKFTEVMPVLERVSDVMGAETNRLSMSESLTLKNAVIRDRLRSACRIAALEARNKQLKEANHDLSRTVEKLESEVIIDPLTQITNKRGYEESVKRSAEMARRMGIDIGLLMVDVDRFKFINDSFGHSAGNEVLQEVARRLRTSIRGSDTIARVGGEEFIAIIHGSRDEEEMKSGLALALAGHRLSTAINSAPFIVNTRRGSKPLRITISIGGTRFVVEEGDTVRAMEQRADEYMYAAKKAGRNRVNIEGSASELSDNLAVPKQVIDPEDVSYIKIG